MLTDHELLEKFRDFESDRVERKAAPADMAKIRRTVCAFANDLPGHSAPGVVFVGVHDDGRCAGLPITDELLSKLAQVRSSGDILPVPSIAVSKREFDGCTVAAVVVQPSGAPPVRLNGRIWVRIGPTTQEAGADDERVLRERARSRDQPFDRRPDTSAALSELDIGYFEREYLPLAVAPDVLARNHRTTNEQLASLRFVVGGVPTHGALILFGKDPGAFVSGSYVQFLRIDGTELGDPVKDDKKLAGPLHQIIHQLDDLLELNVAVAVDLRSARREQRSPDYPVAALQQLVRNALMHRNYETSHAPVRVYWFADRIEIHSPGGPFGQVTRENFGTGVTDYRNPLIAEALANLGYVQRFGFGIPTARKLLEQNGNPPLAFDVQSAAVLVTVKLKT